MNTRPLLFLLLILSLPTPSLGRDALLIAPESIIQEHFLGINAVYHGFSYLPESLEMGMTDELRALELARVKESGIRIARTLYRPDWAMGDGPWLRPDWNSPRMKALYAWLADLQGLGVDVALNMGWWFPRDVIWNRDQHLPAYPDDLQAYCRWVSDSVHQIVQVHGFTHVKYLIMFTEPADTHGNAPAGKPAWEYYREVLRAVNQRLIDDGRRQLVRMVGPNTSQAPMWLDKVTTELDPVLDIYASHNYNFTTYQQWYDLALAIKEKVAPTGKPFWIDEYGVQDFTLRQSGRYGTILALANAAFLNAGAQSSFLWILNDQYYPSPLKHLTNGDSFLDGKHSWGLYPWLPESRATRPGWDAFALLARSFAAGEGKVVKTTGVPDLPIAATVRDDGGMAILVVNVGNAPREVTVQFSREVTLPRFRHAFIPEAWPRLTAEQLPLATTRGQAFEDTLLPDAVVVYSTTPPDSTANLVVHQADHEAEGSDNLALHKEVKVSSVDPDWPGTLATDGKRLTAWRSEGRPKRVADTVDIDLGGPFTVRRIEVFQGDGGERRERGERDAERRDFRLMVSADNKNWQRIAVQDKRTNTTTPLFVTMAPRSVRYIRVVCQAPKRPSADGLFRATLGEVKVFGVANEAKHIK